MSPEDIEETVRAYRPEADIIEEALRPRRLGAVQRTFSRAAIGRARGERSVDPPIASAQSPAVEPTREEIDAKIAASETRTDVKFAQVIGRFDVLDAKLGALHEATRGTKATVIGTGIAAAGLVIAGLAYGATWFGLGINASDVAEKAAVRVLDQYRQNERTSSNPAVPPVRPP